MRIFGRKLFFLALCITAITCAGETNEFAYSVVDDQVTIKGYIGTNTVAKISDFIEGKSVIHLSSLSTPREFWVEYYSAAHIRKYRNSICPPPKLYRKASDRLESVTLPPGITNLSVMAFEWCPRLAAITVDERNPVFSSEDGILMNKEQSTLIVYPPAKKPTGALPTTITHIAPGALAKNSWLRNLRIPSNVTHIGPVAIRSCPNLRSVIIPASVTSIGPRPVSMCDDFSEYKVDPRNPNFTAEQGMLFNKDATRLIQCPPASPNVSTLPNSLKTIGTGAFYKCKALTVLEIPDSVTRIERKAFLFCPNLETLFIPASVISIEDLPVDSCYKFKDFTVDPDNPNYSAVDGVLFNKDRSRLIQFPTIKEGIYEVPATVTTIGEHAFQNYRRGYAKRFSDIVIPAHIKNLDKTFAPRSESASK
ncbi:leucine-rich repeat domain-containing protein [Pontiellaceae bacterium B1224]|nr:leucine-rich repeat domain-containing protein [Pontiellaceae bacterium B1224]